VTSEPFNKTGSYVTYSLVNQIGSYEASAQQNKIKNQDLQKNNRLGEFSEAIVFMHIVYVAISAKSNIRLTNKVRCG